MNVEVKKENGKVIFTPDSRVDSTTSQDLEKVINETEICNGEKISLDFSSVDYISSMGIRVLAAAYKKYGSLEIENAGGAVKEILKLSGLLNIFDVR